MLTTPTPSIAAAAGGYDIVHQIATYVVEARGQKLPPDVCRKIGDCVFDLLIAAIVGTNANGVVATRKTVKALAPTGQSSIWCTSQTSNSLHAAWANAAAAAAADLDDGNKEAKGHPGATVIPVAIAFAEALGSSPEELYAAIDIGYNVGVTIGEARKPDQFGVSNTWGAYAAAATASALLKLDVGQIEHATGLAGGHTPSHTLKEDREPGERPLRFEGSDLKEAIAWAVHTGITAAMLARNGHTGPRNVLQFKTIYKFQKNLMLGSKHRILETYTKFYASCRYAYPATDAALELQARNDFRIEDIVSIKVDTFSNAYNLVPATSPKNDAELIYSIPYNIALPLIDGQNALLPFTKRPFRNQGGTFDDGGWMAGPDVIPGRCSKPCRRPHVDTDHPCAA